jgi:ADP-ribose pyrophosphatase
MRTVLFETKYLRLCDRSGWVYAERANAHGVVVMIAVTPERKVLFVEQFRNPVDKKVLEMPAGLVGDEPGAHDEDLAAAAGRELVEETGWQARKIERVCGGPVSAGMSSEILTFFLCTKLERISAGGGVEGENISTYEVPIEKAREWLVLKEGEGYLVDPKVYAGLYFAERALPPKATKSAPKKKAAKKAAPKTARKAAPARKAAAKPPIKKSKKSAAKKPKRARR